MFVDTHCHIHEEQFFSPDEAARALKRAHGAGVSKVICVGTSVTSSAAAIDFARLHPDCAAVVGVHPHDTKDGIDSIGGLLRDNPKEVVGIGEIGLDYHYTHSPKSVQIAALEQQLQWASEYSLPVSFHVRDAFTDFWPIVNNFGPFKAVLHSFTDTAANLEEALSRGYYIGLNGISTFTKQTAQQQMYDSIPSERIVFETDAPFLTPAPHRGTVNEPAFVRNVAEYHANRRKVELEHLARVTSMNASTLFSI